MKYEKFLPLGSVVMLKEGKKRIMITGYLSCEEGDKSKVYDYTACLYPEGVLSSTQNLLFNHDQIDKIYAIGYNDDEAKNFQVKLKEAESKVNSGI